jgi:hypothetical protein
MVSLVYAWLCDCIDRGQRNTTRRHRRWLVSDSDRQSSVEVHFFAM